MHPWKPRVNSIDFGMGLLLLSLFFFYGYHRILPLEPQSVHHWRQADCASIAWHYYAEDAHFFTPAMHNQVLNDGHTAGEFPILYYLSGMLMRLLGPHPWLARSLNVLILFIGLWAHAHTVKRLTGDAFWAVVLPAMLFASPVLVYYASTTMPEGPAMGLTLLGWHFFFRFYQEEKTSLMRWAVFFFSLATAIKVSFGVSLAAVMAIWFIEVNAWGQFGENRPVFGGKRWRYASCFALGMAFVAAWYVYADAYNTSHGVRYFLTGIRPVSEASPENFSFVAQRFLGLNATFAYFFLTHLLIIFLLFFSFSRAGRKYPLLYSLSLLSFMGVSVYVLLFFQLFNVHDYYLVAMLIFPMLLFLHSVGVFRAAFPQVESSRVFRGLVLGLLLLNVLHAKGIMDHRYGDKGRMDLANQTLFLPEMEDFLTSIGVGPAEKVISLPDESPNASLYLLDRKGWSGYNVRQLPADMEFYIGKGARFLVIHDTTLLRDPDLQPWLGDHMGHFRDVYVYRLAGR